MLPRLSGSFCHPQELDRLRREEEARLAAEAEAERQENLRLAREAEKRRLASENEQDIPVCALHVHSDACVVFLRVGNHAHSQCVIR